MNVWLPACVRFQAYPRKLSSADVTVLYAGGQNGAALDAKRLTTTRVLDQRGLPISVTDPRGNTTSYEYDAVGNPTVTRAPAVPAEIGGGAPVTASPITMTGYNTFGEVAETEDANGNVTTTAYDAAGHPTSVTAPSYTAPGTSTPITAVATTAYNLLGQKTSTTDPLNHQATYVYDQLGNPAVVTEPNTGVTHLTYDLDGEQLSVTDPSGAVQQATYDYLGRTLTSTDIVRQPTPASDTTTYAYTAPGGEQSSAASPGGVSTTYTYDNVGERLTAKDAQNNTTSYTYDGAGRTVRTTAPDNTYQTVRYDQAGNAVGVGAFNAANTQLAAASKAYDADGNVVSATDPRGTTVTDVYDATNALTSQVEPVTATTNITTTYGYDLAGNRTRYTDGRGNAFITTYNAWGLPETSVEPSTAAYPDAADRTTTKTYDADGRPTTTTLPGGVTLTNNYDSVGDLTAQTGQSSNGADATTASRTFGYDLAGRMTSASAPGGTDAFSYDDRGELLNATGPSGASSFAYTADGQMSARTDAAGTTNYGYDSLGRLSTLANTTVNISIGVAYNVNSQPNLLTYGTGNTRALQYDDLHRLTGDTLKTPSATTIASISYGYDANSNLTSKTTTGFSGRQHVHLRPREPAVHLEQRAHHDQLSVRRLRKPDTGWRPDVRL